MDTSDQAQSDTNHQPPMAPKPSTPVRTFFRSLITIILLISGLVLGAGGIKLVLVGGSGYYLCAGIAYLLCALLLFLRWRITTYFALAIFIATCIWTWFDVPSFTYWYLVPRIVVPAILLILTLWCCAFLPKVGKWGRSIQLTITALGIVALGGMFGAGFYQHDVINNPGKIPSLSLLPDQDPNWTSFGRDAGGTRFVPANQITPKNVHQLQVAWTYHTGRRIHGAGVGTDENTPIQVGNTLYSCTPENIVTAINGDTGHSIWRFDPHASSAEHVSCRSVAYYNIDTDPSLSPQEKAGYTAKQCRSRILVSTVDGRLIALDAKSGKPCDDFGDHGTVNLLPKMGPTEGGKRYHPTSTPVVMGHLAVVGGWVRDLQSHEPSGAVRAYDVITGKQAWAWDVGKPSPSDSQANAESGDQKKQDDYTPDTPNVWSVPTYNKYLHLVYVPTGNAPPDYWGGDRNAVNNKYGSSVVALDVNTGQVRWSFQTVHHDVWDYDVPSQPVLTEIRDDDGRSVQALIQTTKNGNIFVLDPATGKPLTEVDEQSVPTSPHAEGEKLSPTQPYSNGMPRLGANPLSENSMWGLTPFDQMFCRIEFKSSNYQGDFTPPSASRPYIEYPGLLGGMNWGGISIDPTHRLMFVNDMRMALRMQLISRKEAQQEHVSTDEVPGFMGQVRPQLAGPYGGTRIDYLQSPLGVPCNPPPFGTMTAINLDTRQIVWQRPMGSTEDNGPLGINTHLHMPLGMPTLGGPTSTASGLIFFAGTQDHYLRAINELTGETVWKARLPVGAAAAPLVYTSPKTGKEYVVISAGGSPHSSDRGDYLIAYALPDQTNETH